MAIGCHEVTFWISETAQGWLGWCAVSLPGQAPPGHGVSRQRVQIRCRCSGLSGSRGFVPGLFCFLLAPTRSCCCGFRFHLLAGLTDPGQPVLTPPQFIGQITAAVALAIAPILLGIEDLDLLAKPQDLDKQIAQRVEIAVAELTDPAVVRLLVTGQHPERQVLVAGPLDLVPPARWPAARQAGGDDAHA